MSDIELRIRDLNQLFDTLDPAPFRTKALDRNTESYLIECAGEHGNYEQLRIVIHGADDLAPQLDDIREGIHAHFALALQQAEKRHRRRKRVGRVALAAGVLTLAVTLSIREWVGHLGGTAGNILSEGLLILAWVALWRPIETIGFDSWDSLEERRLLGALAKVPVGFVTSAEHPIRTTRFGSD